MRVKRVLIWPVIAAVVGAVALSGCGSAPSQTEPDGVVHSDHADAGAGSPEDPAGEAAEGERFTILVIEEQVDEGTWLAHTYPNGRSEPGIPQLLIAETGETLAPNQVVWVTGVDHGEQDGRMVLVARLLRVDVPREYSTPFEDIPYESPAEGEQPAPEGEFVIHGTLERRLEPGLYLVRTPSGEGAVVRLEPEAELTEGAEYSFVVNESTETRPEGKVYPVVRARRTDVPWP